MKNLIKKTLNFLVTLLVCSSLISSCKKDDDGGSNPFPPSGSTLKTSILGTIKDTDGMVVSGAMVKLGTYTTTTDARGNFQFINADVSKDRLVIIASKDGFFDCVRAKRTQSGEANYIHLLMEEKPAAVNVAGVAGGVVNIPGGAKITFPANAFVDAAGNAYTGNVKVYARHISPGDDNFEAIVPGGDLSGINSAGQVQTLFSLGMIEASLTDNAGLVEVKLAPGKMAELKFPIDPSQTAVAQSTIPLWYLNETTGVWKEEGEAIKTGNTFVGNVSHFSTWNCDYSGERTDIQGKVVDCNNNPVGGIVVTINGFMNVTTDNSGAFTSWVPAGFTIECQALMVHNSILTSDSPVQTITAVASILNIVPPIIIPCATTLIGSVKNCEGTSNSPAIIYCSWNGGGKYIFTSTGNYIIQVPPNTSIIISATGIGVVGNHNFNSGSIGTINQVPNILLCNANPALALNQISLSSYLDPVGTTDYLLTILYRVSEFNDLDGDGVAENIYFYAEGKAFPGNYDFDFEFTLVTDSGGYYSLLDYPTNNNYITFSIDPNISGGSGEPGVSPVTSNRILITDYGSPGAPVTGTFEFDYPDGIITNGQFSYRRGYD